MLARSFPTGPNHQAGCQYFLHQTLVAVGPPFFPHQFGFEGLNTASEAKHFSWSQEVSPQRVAPIVSDSILSVRLENQTLVLILVVKLKLYAYTLLCSSLIPKTPSNICEYLQRSRWHRWRPSWQTELLFLFLSSPYPNPIGLVLC
jgi:hypothetical protein